MAENLKHIAGGDIVMYPHSWSFRCLLLVLLLLPAGCTSVQLSDYADQHPQFDMEEFFNGHVLAYGIVQNRSGQVIRRMTIDIQCSWQDDIGTLDEHFTYADGTKEHRVWTLRKLDDRYIGTAADIVGEATGFAAGNALHWNYVLALPVGDKVYNLNFDDWMWQINDTIVMNRAVFSKFGFKLGEVFITFHKQ
jgi:hypothetical protein